MIQRRITIEKSIFKEFEKDFNEMAIKKKSKWRIFSIIQRGETHYLLKKRFLGNQYLINYNKRGKRFFIETVGDTLKIFDDSLEDIMDNIKHKLRIIET